eukprot:1314016-Amphidinium_carterae.1
MKALHSLATTSPLMTCSNIQLNTLDEVQNIPMHVDGKNCGQSYTISCGDLDGAMLQLQNADRQMQELSCYQRSHRTIPESWCNSGHQRTLTQHCGILDRELEQKATTCVDHLAEEARLLSIGPDKRRGPP